MSATLQHVFQSGKSSDGDPTKVQPENWNDYHKFVGGGHGGLLMRDITDSDYGSAWLLSVAAGKVLASNGVGAAPVYTDAPYIAGGIVSALTDPASHVNGQWWWAETGVSPNMNYDLKMKGSDGIVRTIFTVGPF
jgi:hypothetical protein